IDAAIFREWVLNVGRRDAVARLAHAICEIYVRLDKVGLTAGSVCQIPLTQAELADTTGMSVVHLNRSMMELRERNLLRWKGKSVEVLDWSGLAEAAGFDDRYLHISDGGL